MNKTILIDSKNFLNFTLLTIPHLQKLQVWYLFTHINYVENMLEHKNNLTMDGKRKGCLLKLLSEYIKTICISISEVFPLLLM